MYNICVYIYIYIRVCVCVFQFKCIYAFNSGAFVRHMAHARRSNKASPPAVSVLWLMLQARAREPGSTTSTVLQDTGPPFDGAFSCLNEKWLKIW